MVDAEKGKTVGDVQKEMEAALARLSEAILPPGLEGLRYLAAPRGMAVRVSLRRDSRCIRRDANAAYWEPSRCEATVQYEPAPQGSSESGPSGPTEVGNAVQSELHDLVLALDAAEREPRFREFVGIKPFRDQFLPARGLTWAADPAARHKALSQAIQEGMILKSSVANPKAAAFPTTAIKLNRQHPAVKLTLDSTTRERSIFRPISIRGEPISSTVMAGRR